MSWTNDLPDSVALFLSYLEVQKGYSVQTVTSYSLDLLQFNSFLERGDISLASPELVAAEHISRFMTFLYRRRIAKSSISRKLSALRTFFKFCQRNDIVTDSPLAGFANPKQDKPQPRFLNADQAIALLEAKTAPDPKGLRNLALVELLYGSGMRISEALGLDLMDIDLGRGIARVFGKGGKERLSPLTGKSVERLKLYIEQRQAFGPAKGETAVFLGLRGKRMHRAIAGKAVAELAEVAGLPSRVTPHVLRHSFASHMLQSGVDLRSVQELLGHSRLTTTQRYTHLNMDALVKVYDQAHPRAGRKRKGKKTDICNSKSEPKTED